MTVREREASCGNPYSVRSRNISSQPELLVIEGETIDQISHPADRSGVSPSLLTIVAPHPQEGESVAQMSPQNR